jgi:RES domain-containing protein
VQRSDRVLRCYRIGDPDGAFPIYDSEGARLYPGRWNTPTSPVIYTSEHYSTAMLEGKRGCEAHQIVCAKTCERR